MNIVVDPTVFVLIYQSLKNYDGRKLQKSSDVALDDVLDVVQVYSDNKISLVKVVRQALKGIKPGDRLVIAKLEEGCLIKKLEIKELESHKAE